jgi:rhodanese-related sulfurtransferase
MLPENHPTELTMLKTHRKLSIPVLAALLLAMLAGCASNASLPKEINASEAKKQVDQGAFLLDVRQPEEWNETHVPGATLIPLAELPNRLAEVPKDKPVVVMCRSGNRSQQGRDILLNAGYGQVTSMAGGINDWAAQGYPTVSGP